MGAARRPRRARVPAMQSGSAAGPTTTAPAHRRLALLRSALVLAAATVIANAFGYALLLVAGRALGPEQYGALAALLNLSLIGAVPALAVQLVAARALAGTAPTAVDPSASASAAGQAGRLGFLTGVALAVAFALAAPLLDPFLQLGGVGAPLALAATLIPGTVTFAVQGVLQGGERFGRLALLFCVAAGARFCAGAVAATTGAGVTGVVVAGFVAATVAAGVAFALAPDAARGWFPLKRPTATNSRTAGRTPGTTPGTTPGARPAAPREAGPAVWREMLHSSVSTGGLLVLVNGDVLLARHLLAPSAAGLYAAGSIFTKVTFWGPQFLATLLFARMTSSAGRRRALSVALGATAGLGLTAVAGCAVAGQGLVRLVVGPAYQGLGRDVALFAALGTALAVVQVLVYAGIATGDTRIGLTAWPVAAFTYATAAVLGRNRPDALVTTMLGGAGTLVLCGLVFALGRDRSRGVRTTSSPPRRTPAGS